MQTPDAREFQSRLQRLEGLIGQSEQLPDPAARETARTLVRAVLDVHSAGLSRILGHIAEGEGGGRILAGCAADEIAGGLLLLHGLHPLDLEDRVRQALDQVRPRLRGHGGVELVGVENGVVRLRLGGGLGPSPAGTVRQLIDEAIGARAPDAAGLEIEGEPAADDRFRVALPVV